jgi:hypothetical protein
MITPKHACRALSHAGMSQIGGDDMHEHDLHICFVQAQELSPILEALEKLQEACARCSYVVLAALVHPKCT